MGRLAQRDVLSGGALLAFSVLYFLGARGLPPGRNEPGPAFFPMLLAAALFVLALTILIRGLKRRPASTEAWRAGKPLILVILTLGYVTSFHAIGFAASTLLYTLSATLLLKPKRRRLWILIPIGTTAFIYILFGWGLGVPLPPPMAP